MRRAFVILFLCPFLATLVMGTVSCSGNEGVNAANTSSTVKSRTRDKQVIAMGEFEGEKALEERYAFDTRSLKRDKQGNFVGAVRSQYETRKNVSFGGGAGTSAYKAPRYSAPQWTGSTQAQTNAYGGNVDGSRFQVPAGYKGNNPSHLSQQSQLQGSRARTSTYNAGAARERSRQSISKPTDGWTDFRRRVHPQPSVISREDYDKLTAEQYRGILGRED